MIELLIKAVSDGALELFRLDYYYSDLQCGYLLHIYLNKSGKNQSTYKSIEELMKEANELDQLNLEIALSQYVTKLLKEFSNGLES